jgi:Uma2 family endonuclease
MSTAVTPETAAPAATTTPPPAVKLTPVDAACALMSDPSPWRMVLPGVTWTDYQRLLAARAAAGRRRVRINYAHGEVEVMTVGAPHERWKRLIATMLDIYLAESGVPFIPFGGMTIAREDLDRGFEPDECYYLRPASAQYPIRPLNFATDPPPDLAVEVEASRSVGGRLPYYAAIGVREVWQFDGETIAILILQPDRQYREEPAGTALPGFPFGDVSRFVRMAEEADYGTFMNSYREHVRTLVAAPPSP